MVQVFRIDLCQVVGKWEVAIRKYSAVRRVVVSSMEFFKTLPGERRNCKRESSTAVAVSVRRVEIVQ